MPSAATLLLGRPDPVAILEAIAADLVLRGQLLPDAAETAKVLVKAGRLPSTALLEVGANPDFVLLALSTVAGVPPAPPRSKWVGSARSMLPVDDRQWGELLAVPIGTSGARPLVAFADVTRIASHAALALPDHAPCVALEGDVREMLASSTGPVRSAVAFLAPPDAVAKAMNVGPSPFAPATKDAPAAVFGGSGTLLGAPVVATPPAPPVYTPGAPSQPFTPGSSHGSSPSQQLAAPLSQPFSAPLAQPMSPSPLPPSPQAMSPQHRAPLPRAATPSGTLLGTGGVPLERVQAQMAAMDAAGGTGASGTLVITPMSNPSAFGASPSPSPAAHALAGHAMGAQQQGIGPGVRCGRFTLDKLLGQGGMATVYFARSPEGETAAVKVVHDFLLRSSNGEELRRRFQREVKTMRSLEHKNIVACLDAGRVGDTEYITTEYVAGGSLSGLLTSATRLPPMLALCFFEDLLHGLQHAHEKGVVHRDLKPDNLLLDASGALKVADFGIARVAEGTKLTEDGRTVGTPAYMSPEQATASATLDARSDLYSAGVILYEALTGRNPFEADSVGATLANVMLGRVTPVAEVEPAVPFLVDIVLGKLLPFRPDDRLPSARATLDALQPLLEKAQPYRALWAQLVQKNAASLAEANQREAALYANLARKELALGDNHRMRAGFAAYRATTLVGDHKDARSVLSQATKQKPLRFARSATPALLQRETQLEQLIGDDRREAHRAVAQGYFDEFNPALAAAHGRRALLPSLEDEPTFRFLRQVMPDDEVDDVQTLPGRLGKTMVSASAQPWRPAGAVAPGATTSMRATPAEPAPAANAAWKPRAPGEARVFDAPVGVSGAQSPLGAQGSSSSAPVSANTKVIAIAAVVVLAIVAIAFFAGKFFG